MTRLPIIHALWHDHLVAIPRSWTDIAHELGSRDQMHLVQDVAEFSGETPGRLLAAVETAYRVTLDGAAVERAVGVPGGAAVYDVTSSCIVEGREE